MRYKKLELSVLLLIGLGLTGLHAQQSVNASGGNASGSGGTASYSLGQVVYTTHTGANVALAQGIQQPYEISIVAGIEESLGISLSVSVYPNPATDFLTLSIDEFDLSDLVYQLYDMNGRLMQNGIITGKLTTIHMSNLAPAGYFVKVIQGRLEIKTFKVIKH